jgi:hypothetical protein
MKYKIFLFIMIIICLIFCCEEVVDLDYYVVKKIDQYTIDAYKTKYQNCYFPLKMIIKPNDDSFEGKIIFNLLGERTVTPTRDSCFYFTTEELYSIDGTEGYSFRIKYYSIDTIKGLYYPYGATISSAGADFIAAKE